MVPVWRLLRNRHTRWLYEQLEARGVTAARMLEYAVDMQDHPPDTGDAAASEVAYSAAPYTEPHVESLNLDVPIRAAPLNDEWAVVATAGHRAVGRVLVSAGERPHVKPLGRELAFDGAYVRRVYVSPAWRNEGIATRLVGNALQVATEEFDVRTAVAMIAVDNRPSRWVFEANGFRPRRQHDYVRLFGREFRRERALDGRIDT